MPFPTSVDGGPDAWCVRCSPAWVADAIANVVLFMPLGIALSQRRVGGIRATVTAGLLSLVVEALQREGIPAGRSASVLDLLTNSTGCALGWLASRELRGLLVAHGSAAGRWALVWATVSTAMLWGGAWATNGDGGRLDHMRASPFAYAPGYGWYGGFPLDASIGGVVLRHEGSGPIVAVVEHAAPTMTVRVRSTGMDSARYPRALFFLHTTADTTPEIVLLQHDTAVQVRVRRNAQRAALYFPMLSLTSVFSRVRARDTVSVGVTVSPAAIRLDRQGSASAPPHGTTLRLTPLLGWSMIQTLVGPAGAGGHFAATVWIVLLMGPVGWFLGRGTDGVGSVRMAASCAVLLLSGLLGPWVRWGTAIPDLLEWTIVTLSLLVPFVAGRTAFPATAERSRV